MKTMQVRDAKAHFSELLDAAGKGEPTTITRHGEPVAMVVPLDAGKKLYPKPKRSIVDHLLAFPGPLEIEKDRRPPREIDL
jgi:prevent-host-death family protein